MEIKIRIRIIDWRIDVSEEGVEYGSFTVISIGSFPFYKIKYYLQVYFSNCVHEIANTQMAGYLMAILILVFDFDKWVL